MLVLPDPTENRPWMLQNWYNTTLLQLAVLAARQLPKHLTRHITGLHPRQHTTPIITQRHSNDLEVARIRIDGSQGKMPSQH